MKSKQGFTLIELLVVIAIIGILSSVVLASLNTARDKGADAAAKANLNGIRAQAELYYDGPGNNTYTNICVDDSNVVAAMNAARDATGSVVEDSFCVVNTGTGAGAAWAAKVKLKSGGYYCVDSRGTASSSDGVAFEALDVTSTTTASCI